LRGFLGLIDAGYGGIHLPPLFELIVEFFLLVLVNIGG